MPKTNSSRNINFTATLVAWPIVSVVLLGLMSFPVGFVIWYMNAEHYTNSLDTNFWITAISVLVAHIVAFVAVPIVLLVTRAVTVARMTAFFVTGVVVVLLQIVLRNISDSLTGIDCRGTPSSCVDSVIPAFHGGVMTAITAVGLIITLVTVYFVTFQRANR